MLINNHYLCCGKYALPVGYGKYYCSVCGKTKHETQFREFKLSSNRKTQKNNKNNIN